MTMGRSWKYVTAWMLATAAAITVSWLGVRIGLAPALTAEAPVAIDVDRRYTEVRLGLPEATPAPSPAATAARRPIPSKAPAVTPPPPPTPSRTSASPTPSAPPPTAPPTATAPAPAQPQAVPEAGEARAAGTAAPDRRPRYRLRSEGGFVTVAYSSTRVDVVDSDPVRGYTASVNRRSDRLLVIRLTGPRHASAITAYWFGGPRAQVVEEYAR